MFGPSDAVLMGGDASWIESKKNGGERRSEALWLQPQRATSHMRAAGSSARYNACTAFHLNLLRRLSLGYTEDGLVAGKQNIRE